MPSSRAASAALATAALTLGAGCGDKEADAPESVKVDIASFQFMPDPVKVRAGGTVTFVNQDRAPHNAEAPGSFNTVRQTTGQAKKVTLDEPGTYDYFCRFHRFMTGRLEVVE